MDNPRKLSIAQSLDDQEYTREDVPVTDRQDQRKSPTREEGRASVSPENQELSTSDEESSTGHTYQHESETSEEGTVTPDTEDLTSKEEELIARSPDSQESTANEEDLTADSPDTQESTAHEDLVADSPNTEESTANQDDLIARSPDSQESIANEEDLIADSPDNEKPTTSQGKSAGAGESEKFNITTAEGLKKMLNKVEDRLKEGIIRFYQSLDSVDIVGGSKKHYIMISAGVLINISNVYYIYMKKLPKMGCSAAEMKAMYDHHDKLAEQVMAIKTIAENRQWDSNPHDKSQLSKAPPNPQDLARLMKENATIKNRLKLLFLSHHSIVMTTKFLDGLINDNYVKHSARTISDVYDEYAENVRALTALGHTGPDMDEINKTNYEFFSKVGKIKADAEADEWKTPEEDDLDIPFIQSVKRAREDEEDTDETTLDDDDDDYVPEAKAPMEAP
uniref:Uncharacterized protein n=1 Tax=Bracon brevicornis TaxID=1563983 RepID=A0A6V7LN88_9HYME